MSKRTTADSATAEASEPQPLGRDELVAAIKEAQAKGSRELVAFGSIAGGQHGWAHPAFRAAWLECLGVTSKPPAKNAATK